MKKLLLPLSLIFFSFSLSAQKAPDPYSPEVTKNFAFDLYQTGFYDEAESEFRRYLFTTSDIDDNAVITLASIYNEKNNLTGINWITLNIRPKLNFAAKEKVDIVQGRLLFRNGDRDNFAQFADSIQNDLENFSLDFKNLIPLSNLILFRNFEEAKELAKNAAEQNQIFIDVSNSLNEYKEKSPGLALTLSMLLPGAGKFYTGSYSQGITSLLSVASFASACAYSGIESEWKSWKPYVYGGCGLVLWIVDIYGSYQSAKRYNAALYRDLCTTTEQVYEEIF